MSTQSAQRSWEAENDVVTIDSTQNALYALPSKSDYEKIQDEAPWRKNPNYFTHVRISALALLKMAIHARSGGSIEVMGLMTGYVSGTSFIITDAFRLPVEATETRVNAQDEANEYIVNYGELSREGGGQQENPVGWYHSHPGYGCWLSGIDVATQKQQQMLNDPFVAVVIDPDRTVSAGKVEIGGFRTYPDGHKPTRSGLEDDGFQSIPTNKIEDFGAHASSYYSLEVTHFKSTLDTSLLNLLWNKYWTSTLSQSPLFTNRDYVYSQISDHAVKIHEASRKAKGSNNMGRRVQPELTSGAGDDKNIKVKNDATLEAVVKAGNKINSEAYAGLMASEVKTKLFWNVIPETKVRIATEAATQAAAGNATAQAANS